MIRYALIFLIIAIVAAVLGFKILVGVAAFIAKALILLFLVMAIMAMTRKA